MRSKDGQKRIIVFLILLGTISFIVYFKFLEFYKNDFKIMKTINIDKQYSLLFVDEAGSNSNIYIIKNDAIKIFNRNKSRLPILKTTKIFKNDINISYDDNMTLSIDIKKEAYLYGHVLHFQNYYLGDNLKEYRIILRVVN